MYIHIYIYIYIYTYRANPVYTGLSLIYIYKIYIFPTGENGGKVPTLTSLKFAHPPQPRKISL